MKRLSIQRLGAVLVALLMVGMGQAQPLPYPMDTVRGKVYYLYPVQKSEGLYRISKNFNVSQEDIVACNPVLQSQGLREGQIVRIPYVQPLDSTQYIVHILQPKETLYGLSKRYGVSINKLVECNPEVSKRMNIGDRLLIPRSEITPKKESPIATKKDTAVAPVEPKVAEKPILMGKTERTNPLKRPKEDKKVGLDTAKVDSLPLPTETVVPATDLPIRIAYLLPLMTDVAQRTPTIDRFVEFYEGALLAIQNLQKTGQKFEIYVYDIEKNNVKLQKLLQRPEFLNMDAIVGPAYPSQVSLVSEFAFAHHIPTLVPFTSKIPDLERNPYLLQFNPSQEAEIQAMCHYLCSKKTNARCIFIGAEDEESNATVAQIRQGLDREMRKNCVGIQPIDCVEVPYSAFQNDSLLLSLRSDKDNILIFASDKYADIEPLLPKVKGLQHATILSYYAWQKYDLPLPTVYTTVFQADPSFFALRNYEAQFEKYFKHSLSTTDPRYDLLGYDLTSYLVRLLQQSTSTSFSQAVEQPYKGLQSEIQLMRKTMTGGYENQNIRIVRK